jgi:ATP-binding cassette, subfamily B, bacterial
MGALVAMLGLLQAGVFLLSYRHYQELMSQDLQAQSKAQSYLVQMLARIETLKAGGTEDRAVEQWSNLFVDELNVSLKRGRLSAAVDSLMNALRLGAPLLPVPVLVLVYGGFQVLDSTLNLGTMLALSALASGFLSPISTLVSTALQLQLLLSYIERIDDVLIWAAHPGRSAGYLSQNCAQPKSSDRGSIRGGEVHARQTDDGPLSTFIRAYSL